MSNDTPSPEGAEVGPSSAGGPARPARGGTAGDQGDGVETVSSAGVRRWLEAFAREVSARKDELTELDAAIGDADHGINLDHGMAEVIRRLGTAGEGSGRMETSQSGGSPGTDLPVAEVLKAAGMALLSTVGGAAGPLYGSLLLKMGGALGGALGSSTTVPATDWARALREGVRALQARGRAEPGDKTMVDALLPALATLEEMIEAGEGLGPALDAAAGAAREGMEATIPLVARRGRASYLGERSAGHRDPGATSSYLLIAAARTLAGPGPASDASLTTGPGPTSDAEARSGAEPTSDADTGR